MTRRGAIVGLVTLAAGAACGVKAESPPHIEVDRTPCAHCGMLISETMFAAAYKAPGAEARAFDDIGCLLASAKREADPGGLRFWFHDAPTGDWIAGTDATFVRSDRLRTPMNGGLVAYRDAAAAERGAAEYQGGVIRSLTDLLGERLRPERGAKSPSESERGWGPASPEKRPRPERGAKSPSESERGWGPASAEKRGTS